MKAPCPCTQPHIVAITMSLFPVDTTVCLLVQIVRLRYVLPTPALEEVGDTEMCVAFASDFFCTVANKSIKQCRNKLLKTFMSLTCYLKRHCHVCNCTCIHNLPRTLRLIIESLGTENRNGGQFRIF
jgi:hypothetical protein